MNRFSLFLAAFLLAFLDCILCLPAEDARALAIIRQVDAQHRTESPRMEMSMEIRPSDGTRPRSFSLVILENRAGDSHLEFTSPRTVQGMRILSRGSSSWVFFPSTGRTRKIGSSSRSGSVQGVGGDFSYDDLGGGSWEEDYAWTLDRETDGFWELTGARRDDLAAYDRVFLRIDRRLIRPVFCRFALESEGGFYKELELKDFRDYSGRIRPAEMIMSSLKEGSSTRVLMDRAEFGIPEEAGRFDPARFGR